MDQIEIKKVLKEAYEDVFLKPIEDENINLLSLKIGNSVIDYLYWIDAIEQRLNYPVSKLFEAHDYRVMTLNHLTMVLDVMINNSN